MAQHGNLNNQVSLQLFPVSVQTIDLFIEAKVCRYLRERASLISRHSIKIALERRYTSGSEIRAVTLAWSESLSTRLVLRCRQTNGCLYFNFKSFSPHNGSAVVKRLSRVPHRDVLAVPISSRGATSTTRCRVDHRRTNLAVAALGGSLAQGCYRFPALVFFSTTEQGAMVEM